MSASPDWTRQQLLVAFHLYYDPSQCRSLTAREAARRRIYAIGNPDFYVVKSLKFEPSPFDWPFHPGAFRRFRGRLKQGTPELALARLNRRYKR